MNIKCLLRWLAILIFFIPSYVLAQPVSPEGYWQTYDLHHVKRDLMHIFIHNGQLIGVGVNTKKEVCTACSGNLKNKPINGLTLVWGLKQKGDEWVNGTVLDIDNGKTYRCHLSVSKNNQTLYFSPYIGMPWMGPTLRWMRVK